MMEGSVGLLFRDDMLVNKVSCPIDGESGHHEPSDESKHVWNLHRVFAMDALSAVCGLSDAAHRRPYTSDSPDSERRPELS